MTKCKIVKDNNRYQVDISGHAGFSPGNDPVCAAISILSFTLMQMVTDMEATGGFREFYNDYRSGVVHVDVTTASHARTELEGIIRTIRTGFELLQKRYPNNLQLEVLGWEK